MILFLRKRKAAVEGKTIAMFPSERRLKGFYGKLAEHENNRSESLRAKHTTKHLKKFAFFSFSFSAARKEVIRIRCPYIAIQIIVYQ